MSIMFSEQFFLSVTLVGYLVAGYRYSKKAQEEHEEAKKFVKYHRARLKREMRQASPTPILQVARPVLKTKTKKKLLPAPKKLMVSLGHVPGEPTLKRSIDLFKAPHLMVTGTTGSGKSTFLNRTLCNLLKQGGKHISVSILDGKRISFIPYRKVNNVKVYTKDAEFATVIAAIAREMDERYGALEEAREEGQPDPHFSPHIVLIDEFAQLTEDKKIKATVSKLVAQAREARIHLITSTQFALTSVLGDAIKNMCPVAFRQQPRTSVQAAGLEGASEIPRSQLGAAMILTDFGPELTQMWPQSRAELLKEIELIKAQ